MIKASGKFKINLYINKFRYIYSRTFKDRFFSGLFLFLKNISYNKIIKEEYTMLVSIIFFITTYFFILLVPIILSIVSWWVLYEKAGFEGWESIIPIYNIWVKIRIAYSDRNTLFYFILLFIPIINIISVIMLNWNFVSRYTDNSVLKILYLFFPFIIGLVLAFSDEYVYLPDDYDLY